tara:strand:- start:170 stop:472 length:303 start_codon:yes stop_codon:yes gene_type:complete
MTICKFEIGDLVRCKWTGDIGIVQQVAEDFYGASQAFKVYGAQRGQALTPCSVNGIGPTKDGIRDRLLIQWTTDYEKSRGRDGEMKHYVDSKDVEVVKKM